MLAVNLIQYLDSPSPTVSNAIYIPLYVTSLHIQITTVCTGREVVSLGHSILLSLRPPLRQSPIVRQCDNRIHPS